MPYIPKHDRKYFDSSIYKLAIDVDTVGDLNYCITSLCDIYLEGDVCYSNINNVIGVLECAKQELYRRVAAPYEDMKKEINGDVYDSAHHLKEECKCQS